jgi:aromatic-amino-acid transaminase
MRTRYIAQVGMFTYTGLSAGQIETLRSEHGIYLLRSGRMCVSGLNRANVEYVASAITAVTSLERDK